MNMRQILVLTCGETQLTAYASDIQEIQLAPLPSGAASVVADLPTLLGSSSQVRRQYALLIAFRRAMVALLVDAVEQAPPEMIVQPLPTLISETRQQPWATGVTVHDDRVVIHVDLRVLALGLRTRPSV